MLIEVSTFEAEALRYACAMNDLQYIVFDTYISGIKKVRILDRGREISAPIAYRLKGVADARMREQSCKAFQLPEEEQPIDVLMMIEAIKPTAQELP